jgi:hypothetical protein
LSCTPSAHPRPWHPARASRNTLPPRFRHAEGLFRLVFLRIGFRLLITAVHELRRLLKRGFEQAQHVPVSPDQSTVWIATLVVGKQPFMVADIGKEEGGQYGPIRDVATRG